MRHPRTTRTDARAAFSEGFIVQKYRIQGWFGGYPWAGYHAGRLGEDGCQLEEACSADLASNTGERIRFTLARAKSSQLAFENHLILTSGGGREVVFADVFCERPIQSAYLIG